MARHHETGYAQGPSLAESTAGSRELLYTQDVDIVTFDQKNDKSCPYQWTESRKWLILAPALIGALVTPLNGTAITVAADGIARQFNISDSDTFTNTYWIVTSWTLGGAFFVVSGLPLLEDTGIKRGYMVIYTFFLLMVIPQALARNFATLVVTRFFTGGCVAVLANAAASVVPDLWNTPKGRSLPTSLYILLYVMGDTLGPPLFAGVVERTGDWRWVFYVQLIIYGALWPVFFFFLKETRHEIILRSRAKELQNTSSTRRHYTHAQFKSLTGTQQSRTKTLLKSMTRPVYLLATEPVLFFGTLWSAFSLGLVFLFTQSVEQVFTETYGWNEFQSGYVQAAVVIGEIFGWIASLYGIQLWLKSANSSTNKECPGHPIPEARLYLSVFASFVGISGGMFVYAWTSYPSLPWIAPAVGLFMVGFGTQIVVGAVADYIEDAYGDTGYGGSGLAAVCAGENLICGFLPLASQAMYTDLGFQWASTLIAFLALLLSFAPVIGIWKGSMLRRKSPFMQYGKEDELGSDGSD